MDKFVVYNIKTLATPLGPAPKSGRAMADIKVLKNAYLVAAGGKFIAVGEGAGYQKSPYEKIDAGGGLVTPAFIDAHTHLVFAGSREDEMQRKLRGESYLDILASGGGIHATVAKTRAASEEELYRLARETLNKMLLLGVGVAEAKSGYGLDKENELKTLRVIKRLKDEGPQRLVATYLGAHALPAEYKNDRAGYIGLIKATLEAVKAEELAEFCDVFCEEGVFTYEESREILAFARDLGFKLRIHADEMTNSGGARLASEMKCRFADHLLAASDEDFAALAAAGVVALVLPLTSFFLRKPFARAREMIDRGAAVAIATDYNPGSSPSYNLPLAMQMAVLGAGMTPAEALTAATLNPASGLDIAGFKGSIEVGKDADFIIFDCPNLDYFFYRFGENRVRDVYLKGKKVVNNGRLG